MSIMQKRVQKVALFLAELCAKWPAVTYREVAKITGQLISKSPVFKGAVQIRSRMLQTIVNIRHFNSYNWDAQIRVVYDPLLTEALNELAFWKKLFAHIIPD